MSDLSEKVQKRVEHLVGELKGEADIPPAMILTDYQDRIVEVAMMMPETGGEKDQVAAMMAAICALHRAKEAAFVSAAWMVLRTGSKDEALSTVPAECADRKEVVMVQAVSVDREAVMLTLTDRSREQHGGRRFVGRDARG